jgi:hypothetical protein
MRSSRRTTKRVSRRGTKRGTRQGIRRGTKRVSRRRTKRVSKRRTRKGSRKTKQKGGGGKEEVEALPYYHKITKDEAVEILKATKNNSYLVRNKSSDQTVFVVSFKDDKGKIDHVIIKEGSIEGILSYIQRQNLQYPITLETLPYYHNITKVEADKILQKCKLLSYLVINDSKELGTFVMSFKNYTGIIIHLPLTYVIVGTTPLKKFIEKYIKDIRLEFPITLEALPYYHNITKKEAVEILRANNNNSYLVRNSSKDQTSFVVSLKDDEDRIEHFNLPNNIISKTQLDNYFNVNSAVTNLKKPIPISSI